MNKYTLLPLISLFKSHLVVRRGNLLLKLPTRYLARYRLTEPPLKALKKLLDPSDILLDVGAHIGAYALSVPGEVWAFEPATETFKLLEENIRLNNRYNIHPINVALSNRDGEAILNIFSQTGLTSLTHTIGARDTERVERVTLDSFIDQYHIKPTFIKIDVEGHEMEVLEGARRTLQTFRPRLLIEGNLGELSSVLNSFGYVGKPINTSNHYFEARKG